MAAKIQLDEAVQILARTPVALEVLLDGLPDRWIHANEGPESWSPFEVVGHLIHAERTDWVPRARLILELGEHQPFEPFDRFAHRREFAGRPLRELLERFAECRQASLATLRAWQLTPADLERRGRHPDFGPVTLGELLATWVVHDLGHLGQIARVMAKAYRSAVGPWEAYLPILHR
jgi:hypothetical protein